MVLFTLNNKRMLRLEKENCKRHYNLQFVLILFVHNFTQCLSRGRTFLCYNGGPILMLGWFEPSKQTSDVKSFSFR